MRWILETGEHRSGRLALGLKETPPGPFERCLLAALVESSAAYLLAAGAGVLAATLILVLVVAS